MSNNKVVINRDICKGCGNCYRFCPKKIFSFSEELNVNGYRPASVVNGENCVLCLSCSLMCPEAAIEIYREKQKFQ